MTLNNSLLYCLEEFFTRFSIQLGWAMSNSKVLNRKVFLSQVMNHAPARTYAINRLIFPFEYEKEKNKEKKKIKWSHRHEKYSYALRNILMGLYEVLSTQLNKWRCCFSKILFPTYFFSKILGGLCGSPFAVEVILLWYQSAHSHEYTQTHILTCEWTYTHTYAHTNTHTWADMDTQTHIYINIYKERETDVWITKTQSEELTLTFIFSPKHSLKRFPCVVSPLIYCCEWHNGKGILDYKTSLFTCLYYIHFIIS